MDNRKRISIVFVAIAFVLTIASAVYSTTIKNGTADTETVKKIQTRLKSWGYYNGTVDGSFGAKTEQAIKQFQRENGLKEDGQVGKETFQALGLPQPTSSKSSEGSNKASSNDSDVMLLARCINGEARGEPYEGQVAVGAVILNRVDNPEFPSSISGVIYQSGAFDAVKDGQVNLSPQDSTVRAAKDAMNGWDPTNGCIYYYNPSTATNKWIRSRPIMLTIGNHVFCK